MLAFLIDLLEISLGCSLIILPLLLLTPALAKRFSPRPRCWAWVLLALRLVMPGAFWGVSLYPAPIQVELPAALVQSEYQQDSDFLFDQNRYCYPNVINPYSNSIYRNGSEYLLTYSDEAGNAYEIQNNWLARTVTVNGQLSQRDYHWPILLFFLWLVIATFSLMVELLRYHRFRGLALRWSVPASEEDHASLEQQQFALGIHRKVTLVRSETVSSPLLMGFLSPAILLPARLSGDGLIPALAHELTHLKRQDTLYLFLMTLARCVHWFNPLVWLMERQARQDMELCCDYDLLKGKDEETRRTYGQAILDQMTAGEQVSRLTTGFSGDKKNVFARFRAMMDSAPKKSGAMILVCVLFAVVLAEGLVAFSGAQAQKSETVTDRLDLSSLTSHIQVTPVGTWGQLTEFQVDIAGSDPQWGTVPRGDTPALEGTHDIVLSPNFTIGPNDMGQGLYLYSSFYPKGVSFDTQELGILIVQLVTDPETGVISPALDTLYLQLTAPIPYPGT